MGVTTENKKELCLETLKYSCAHRLSTKIFMTALSYVNGLSHEERYELAQNMTYDARRVVRNLQIPVSTNNSNGANMEKSVRKEMCTKGEEIADAYFVLIKLRNIYKLTDTNTQCKIQLMDIPKINITCTPHDVRNMLNDWKNEHIWCKLNTLYECMSDTAVLGELIEDVVIHAFPMIRRYYGI